MLGCVHDLGWPCVTVMLTRIAITILPPRQLWSVLRWLRRGGWEFPSYLRMMVFVWGFDRDGVCGLNGVDWERRCVIVGGILLDLHTCTYSLFRR